MSEEALKYIADAMESLAIPYDFVMWNGDDPPDPYFIGEYAEEEPLTEDGMQDSTFMITGTTRGSWLSLEQAKTKILRLHLIFSYYFHAVKNILSSNASISISVPYIISTSLKPAFFKRLLICFSL